MSIALHAAMLLVLSRLPSSDAPALPAPAAPPAVLWLRDWRPLQAPAGAAAAAPSVPAAEEPDAARLAFVPVRPPEIPRAPMPERARPVEPAERAPEPPPPVPEPPAEQTLPQQRPQPTNRAEPDGQRPAVALEGVDWEAERRRAIEQLAEEREREERYHTFSLADVLDEPVPVPEEPGPERSIFEPGGNGGGGGVLAPGQARTKAGRFVSDLCNALTGGFSVMGFLSVCAEDNARSDLFAHIKPEYLRRRPEAFVNPRSVQSADQGAEQELEAAVPAAAREAAH